MSKNPIKTQEFLHSTPGRGAAAGDARLQTEKRRLVTELGQLKVTVFPSEANYLLIYSPADICGPLLEKGILIRDCADYPGLGKGYYRIAVRRTPENDRLLAALAEVLE